MNQKISNLSPVLLITGTVQVDPHMPCIAIADEDERFNAYIDTVMWAINETKFDKIVFCENSGYKFNLDIVDNEAKNAGKRFEYITFIADTDRVVKMGKGYGEGEIIDYALTNSLNAEC